MSLKSDLSTEALRLKNALDYSYDLGFEDGCQYEREAIIAIAEINGMTPKDIIRAIQERGSHE